MRQTLLQMGLTEPQAILAVLPNKYDWLRASGSFGRARWWRAVVGERSAHYSENSIRQTEGKKIAG